MIQELQMNLACPVCQEIKEEHVLLNCGHSLSRDCAETMFGRLNVQSQCSIRFKACPLCREKVHTYTSLKHIHSIFFQCYGEDVLFSSLLSTSSSDYILQKATEQLGSILKHPNIDQIPEERWKEILQFSSLDDELFWKNLSLLKLHGLVNETTFTEVMKEELLKLYDQNKILKIIACIIRISHHIESQKHSLSSETDQDLSKIEDLMDPSLDHARDRLLQMFRQNSFLIQQEVADELLNHKSLLPIEVLMLTKKSSRSRCDTDFIEELIALANQNDTEAQVALGYACRKGIGVKINLALATTYLSKAAEKDHPIAQLHLGIMCHNGEGENEGIPKAVEWYTKATEKKNAKAQIYLALIYSEKQYGYLKYPEAADLLLKAAEQGDACAQQFLGSRFEKGKGVKQDDEKAFMWYRKSALQGYLPAQFDLGYSYEYGLGVEKNLTKALKWYRIVAEKDDPNAHFRLFLNSENLDESTQWLFSAANLGHSESQYRLAKMYMSGNRVDQNIVQAKSWFLKSAQRGHLNAQFELGMINLRRAELTENKIQAKKWLRKSAEQEHPIAQLRVGVLYLKDKEEDLALIWLKKAADQGNDEARSRLQTLCFRRKIRRISSRIFPRIRL